MSSLFQRVDNRTTIHRFPSYEDFVSFYETEVVNHPERLTAYDIDVAFYGDTKANCLKYLRHGHDENMPQVLSLMSDMDDAGILTIGQPRITPHVYGFAPNIPAYLAGQPRDMFAKQLFEVESPMAPMRIIVEAGMSSGFSLEQIVNRGVAIMAFIMAMQAKRPVELEVCRLNDVHYRDAGDIISFPIETRGVDISVLCYIFTVASFIRNVTATVQHIKAGDYHVASNLPMAWGITRSHSQYGECARRAFGLGPNDVFIAGGSHDNAHIMRDPMAWTKKMISEYSSSKSE